MTKRATPPSVPLEVSARQPGCSSECSSTPKQLTWGTQDTRSKNVTAQRRAQRARPQAHLDAVFERVPWQGQTFLLVDGLAENDQLLEQENPPLSGSGRDAVFLLANKEGILLEQLPLGGDLALGPQERAMNGNTFASTKVLKKMKTLNTHLETLKSAHIHHVIAAFWHETHHLHGSLMEKWTGNHE